MLPSYNVCFLNLVNSDEGLVFRSDSSVGASQAARLADLARWHRERRPRERNRALRGDPGLLGRAASDGREHGPASAEREPGLGLGLILESPRSQEVLGSPRRSQDSGKL